MRESTLTRNARRPTSSAAAASASTRAPLLLRALAGALREVGVDELGEIAVEHALHVADFVSGPQVLDQLIRLQHVRADLAAEGDVLLLPLDALLLLLPLLDLDLVEPRAQQLHGHVAVLVLAALVLAGHDDAGRQVRDAHRGVGDVDVLPARAAGAVRVDAEVLVVDLDVDLLVDVGIDVHRRERGVAPLGRVVRRDAHEAMHAVLRLEIAVDVLAAHDDRRALDARLVTRLHLDELRRPAAALEEAQVHAQEHLRPVLRLRTARAGVDGDDGVAVVVLAGELHAQLDVVDLGLELGDELLDLVVDVLALAMELEQRLQVLGFGVDRLARCDALLYARALAADVLRLLRIVPEAGRGHLTFDFFQGFFRRSEVKDSSGPRRAGLWGWGFSEKCRLS